MQRRDWDQDWDPREGGRELGTGPKAAGPAERVAVPEKDELVSGASWAQIFFASLTGLGTKARVGVGRARIILP